jgi:tetratricopeptide (TPR) repeat protein
MFIFGLMKTKQKQYLYLLFILIVTVVVYSSAGGLGFVNWDDDDNVRLNSQIQDVNEKNIKQIFEQERYKSLALYSFMLDYAFWQLNPKPYHVHNLLLHVINIILVFLVVLKLTRGRLLIAFVTSALFALHPASVEAVAWVTGRKDLLFMLFSLLSILAYSKYIKRNYNLWLFLLLCFMVFLASIAKIQAFVLPVVLIAMDVFYKRKLTGILILEKVLLFLVVAKTQVGSFDFFAITSAIILIAFYLYEKMDYKKFALRKKYGLLVYFASVCLSLRLLDVSVFEILALGLIGSAILFVLIKRGTIKHFFIDRWIEKTNRFWIITVGVFLVSLALFLFAITDNWWQFSLHFWSDNDVTVFSFADRLLLAGYAFVYYIKRLFLLQAFNPMPDYPDPGLSWSLDNIYFVNFLTSVIVLSAVVFFLLKYYKKNRLLVLGTLIFLINISIVLHIIPIQGRVVAADRYAYPSFWGVFLVFGLLIDQIKYLRLKAKTAIIGILCLGLGVHTYAVVKIWDNSYSLWLRAVKQDVNNSYAANSLGVAYLEIKNDPDSALVMINKALNIDPHVAEYYVDKGRVLFEMDSLTSSFKCLNTALILDTDNDMAYNNRGVLLMKKMEYTKALTDLQTAIDLNNRQLYKENYHKALRYHRLDSIVLADYSSQEFSKSDKLQYIKTVSDKLISKGKEQDALEYLLIGLKLKKNDTGLLQNVAAIYSKMTMYDLSIDYYRKLIALNPEQSDYYYFLANNYFNKGDRIRACKNWSIAKLYGHHKAAYYYSAYCE